LLEEYSKKEFKTHEICTKNVLERAFKSTQNAVLMYNKRNTRHLRTIIPKFSQVKAKTIVKISGIGMRPCEKKQVEMCAKPRNMYLKCTKKGLQIYSKCIINVQKTKFPTSKDNNPKILTREKQRQL